MIVILKLTQEEASELHKLLEENKNHHTELYVKLYKAMEEALFRSIDQKSNRKGD